MRKSLASAPTIDMSISTISTTLKMLRQERGLTLKEVNADTGLSISFLSDLERGKVKPSLCTLEKLGKQYHAWLRVTI